jgi:DNA-binding NarL/FixJ family response regulator
MTEEPYRVVLADDHGLFRQGIKRILSENPNLAVIGEAEDGLDLLNLLDKLSESKMLPHMVLLDITMPNLHGIEATRRIKRTYPQIVVLMLTIHNDMEYLQQAFSAGAEGYLLKEDADTDLFAAIDAIRQGGIYVSPLLSRELPEDWLQTCRGDCKPPFRTDKTTRK